MREREEGPPRRLLPSCLANRLGVERRQLDLDIWADVRDESLEDTAGLREPAVIAEEIAANLTTALEQFAAVAAELSGDGRGVARD